MGIHDTTKDKVPAAMLTLDLWLPPSYVLDSWDVLDSGQLGPATRSHLTSYYETFIKLCQVSGVCCIITHPIIV